MDKSISPTRSRPYLVLIPLLVCLAVLAVGALPAGWSLMLQPNGSGIGLPIEWLDHSPFTNFAIPGFILFALFGVGSLLAIYGLLRHPRWPWTEPIIEVMHLHLHWSLVASALLGLAQCIWITVEWLMTQRYFFLQPIMFGIGLAILLLSIAPSMRRAYAQ